MPPIPQPPYTIKLYPQSTLLSQPFLTDLQTTINTSYHNLPSHSNPNPKTNTRLKTPTQLPTELTKSGITAIAFLPDPKSTIIGTASIKPYTHDGPESDSIWKVPGHFARFTAEELGSGSKAVLDSVDDRSSDVDLDLGIGCDCECECEGEFEIVAVAVLPAYRGLGVAGELVRVCEEEARKRGGEEGRVRSRIHVRAVRDVVGGYWGRRGFVVVGELYCPPFTWGLERGFVLWEMVREL
ncbi:hypothetical protein N7535_007333 [Penicillium sp. DV-2018c]|nr:hypothetical protein N7535_007333 [Penicillium sp. DV-2018c]